MKRKEIATVVSQEQIASDVYSMWIQTEQIAEEAKPGQFISLYCADKSRLLPRPISLCEIDRGKGRVRLVYRVVGKGTDEFSRLRAGDTVEILGPLGNGFPLEEARGKRVLLMGGGIGIPPMLETAKQLDAEKMIVSGYRDELFLTEDFAEAGELYLAVEHPGEGVICTEGNVLDAVRENELEADVIFACGPTPMLRAIKSYALEKEIPCWISMEEKMACGIGACLACVCQSKEIDGHSHVHNKRICKDGPVFLSTEVEL
ncbi:MAG TPA: dihydroorotate dehydrogenase electron transfer subunit [Candidatus Egerieimonas faecigallinarum]|nr:dihydroorotate dehydrogenase electron transfer subunit [Candidatus Egerieimonas faecigallinarum]